MKINDSKTPASLPVGDSQTTAGKRADKTGTSAVSPAATLKSSPMSAQIQALQSAMASSEIFDANKVEAIKLAIADGKFQIDSRKVTAGLLETVKDLLQTRKN
jgi:negative regulator of flagellin synthesis FlgM